MEQMNSTKKIHEQKKLQDSSKKVTFRINKKLDDIPFVPIITSDMKTNFGFKTMKPNLTPGKRLPAEKICKHNDSIITKRMKAWRGSFINLRDIGNLKEQTLLRQPSSFRSDSDILSAVATRGSESFMSSKISESEKFGDDFDLATRLIPSLVSLLEEKDLVVVGHATDMVQQLLEGEVSQLAVVRSPQLVATFVRVCEGSACLDTVKCAIGVLLHMSRHPEGLQNIYEALSVPALIKALASPMEAILFDAIATLENLLLDQKGAKLAVCQAGGLHMMMSLLKRNNDVKFLTIVTHCLRILARGNRENQLMILLSGGSSELVRIMRSYNDQELLCNTSSVIQALSDRSSFRPAIVEMGGVQALAMHLGTDSGQLQHSCITALYHLSDAAAPEIDDLLQGLVQLLGSSDVHFATSACILDKMLCQNVRNKQTVCRAGGVEAVVKAIVQAGDREEITLPAVCVLGSLTSRHPEAELAQKTVRLSCGIQGIVKLLHPPSSSPLIKNVIGLIEVLALCPGNNAPLRDYGAIPRLVQLLTEGYQASTRGSLSSNLDEVRTEEILEKVLRALLVLARDVHNQVVILGFRKVVPILYQLLHCNVKEVRRLAKKVLWLLLEWGTNASSGPPLMELLSPPNETTGQRVDRYSRFRLINLISEEQNQKAETLTTRPTKTSKKLSYHSLLDKGCFRRFVSILDAMFKQQLQNTLEKCLKDTKAKKFRKWVSNQNVASQNGIYEKGFLSE